MKYIVFLLIFCLCFSTRSIAANLLDVYHKTVAFDPSLKQAQAIRLSTLQASPQAMSQLLPIIDLQLNATNNKQKIDYDDKNFPDYSANFRSYTFSLNLRQSILNLSSMNRLKQADITVAMAEVQFARFYQELMYKIVLAYYEFLAANDSLTQYLMEKELTETFLKQVVEKYNNGELAVVDTHDVQARFDKVVTSINYANMRVEAAREALRKLTGEYFVSLSTLKNNIPFVYPEPQDVEWWVTQARSDNFTLMNDRLAIKAAQLNLTYQKIQYYPTVDLVGNYNIYNNSDLNAGGGENIGSTIGLQLNWNLYQGGLNRSYIDQTRYSLTQEKMKTALSETDVEQQARASHYLIYSEINRINDLRRSIISHQQALKANEVAYDLGTRSIRDLLQSIELLSNVNRDFAQARYNYLIQYLLLHKIAGLLDETFIERLNRLLIDG